MISTKNQILDPEKLIPDLIFCCVSTRLSIYNSGSYSELDIEIMICWFKAIKTFTIDFSYLLSFFPKIFIYKIIWLTCQVWWLLLCECWSWTPSNIIEHELLYEQKLMAAPQFYRSSTTIKVAYVWASAGRVQGKVAIRLFGYYLVYIVYIVACRLKLKTYYLTDKWQMKNIREILSNSLL